STIPSNISGVNFGMNSIGNINDLSISLTATPFICNTNSQIWLDVHNFGSTIITGDVSLVLPLSSSLIFANPPFLFQNGDTLYWSLTNLPPGADTTLEIQIAFSGISQFGNNLTASSSIDIVGVDSDLTNNCLQ
ncbi:MAG: hypothetical protein IPN54_02355, partial [Bacteroidetes bacterium]|nr:hypothetical protein [Bacteroidota bacterium]